MPSEKRRARVVRDPARVESKGLDWVKKGGSAALQAAAGGSLPSPRVVGWPDTMNRANDLGPAPPWPQAPRPVWVVWQTSGEDPRVDGLLRLQAQRWEESTGEWVTAQWTGQGPRRRSAEQEARWLEEGLSGDQLDDGLAAADLWQALAEWVGEQPLLVESSERWARWAEPSGIDLPGGVIAWGDLQRLLGELTPAWADRSLPQLQAAFADCVRSAQAMDGLTTGLWGGALQRSAERFEATDPGAARALQWWLKALNRPYGWLPDAPTPREERGWLQQAIEELSDLEHAVLSLVPRASEVAEWDADETPIPPTTEELTPFPKEDLQRLEALFDEHLPAQLASDWGGKPDDYLRPSQRDVALRIAKQLGQSQLLLVHAPTGTGKTLAYLLPVMMWATRHQLRVGVATYTRALQEQAMASEVPRALAALRAAGVHSLPRVALLKGRENYLCWRSFVPQVPEESDDGEAWLAWACLLWFARTNVAGDLDGFPTTPPIPLRASRPYREAVGALLRASRARKSCCTRPKDRSTCLADLARRRAERSHVVITNQSFVLARQEFLRHVIFDECEHLHDGAVSAWSARFEFEEVRRTLARLYRPTRSPARAPINRLLGMLPFGGTSQEFTHRAVQRWKAVWQALQALEEEAQLLDARRREDPDGRNDREAHRYLRQRMEAGEAAGLLQARIQLGSSLAQLEGDLDRVLEVCDANPVRGQASIRRQLELGRAELIEWNEALGACLPLSETGPSFSRELFYDLERRASGALDLVARVLVPFESLGRYYYPDLASAAFVSATTYLGGSFERTKHYLGLTRCESPAEDEERVGRPVATFRVPEVFDYSRVLVGVPRDSAPVQGPKSDHLRSVTDFLATVAERTNGRLLALFTNLDDVRQVGVALEARWAHRALPLLYQGMPNTSKEELSRRFRERPDSVLLGVDTFWFGADFPGETLEYLVIVRLPYGVPDRYHFAQCAAIGDGAQRQQIYMPRALAKFRQGFGRLMRRTTDRGCVFLLDKRILEPKHRDFLRELPLASSSWDRQKAQGARLVRGPKEHVLRAAWQHMGLAADLEPQGIPLRTEGPAKGDSEPNVTWTPPARRERTPPPPPIDIDPSDLPY